MGAVSPNTLGGTTTTLHIYTDDEDKLLQQETDVGATPIMSMADMFWGDRYGQIQDSFGHRWEIATHKKDVSHEEMEKAAKEFFT